MVLSAQTYRLFCQRIHLRMEHPLPFESAEEEKKAAPEEVKKKVEVKVGGYGLCNTRLVDARQQEEKEETFPAEDYDSEDDTNTEDEDSEEPLVELTDAEVFELMRIKDQLESATFMVSGWVIRLCCFCASFQLHYNAYKMA